MKDTAPLLAVETGRGCGNGKKATAAVMRTGYRRGETLKGVALRSAGMQVLAPLARGWVLRRRS
jgi:hypothetical protein